MNTIGASFQQMVTGWNKSNLPSDPAVEYYYDHDMVWKVDTGYTSFKPPSRIVHNVRQIPDGSYEFKFKDIDGTYTTNYGWAFVPYTEENMIKLSKKKELEEQIDNLRRERIKILHNICELYCFKSESP